MLTEFEDQFDNRYISGTKSLTTTLREMATYNWLFPYFDKANPQHLHDIQYDSGPDSNGKGGITALKDATKVLPLRYFEDSNENYYYRDIIGWFTIYRC